MGKNKITTNFIYSHCGATEPPAKLSPDHQDIKALMKMKADIKLYGFKTSAFKGVLATRAKRGSKTGTVAKKAAAKKTTK